MARTGSTFSDDSGDYAIAYSTAAELRIVDDGSGMTGAPVLANAAADPLFLAAIEVSKDANALFTAETVLSRYGTVLALPVEAVMHLLRGSQSPAHD